MGRNHPAGPRLVDGSRLEKGLRFSNPRRGHGDLGGEICRRKIHQPTASQGRILPTGMHRSESKAGPGIFGAYSIPREAGKSHRHHGEYNLWSYTGEREVDWALVI